jgi:hypothetical protein
MRDKREVERDGLSGEGNARMAEPKTCLIMVIADVYHRCWVKAVGDE